MNLLTATRDLISRTHTLIHSSDLTLREIADGSGVKFDWFIKFVYGKIGSPGLDKVQPVHDFLTKPQKKTPKRRSAAA